jgi:hypothetical protein
MRHRLIMTVLCCFAGFSPSAHAVPAIDQSQRVALPRTDPGTGICGNVTHFAPPMMPLTKKSDAEMILNLPMGDPSILSRTARIFDNVNFRNGKPGSSGDFQPPNFRKDVFPYSMDPMAVPILFVPMDLSYPDLLASP